jgi:FkbM family methyltransferase
MISVVIPTYKEPEALDLCLNSAITGQKNKNQIIVVVDGFFDLNKEVLEKYKEYIDVLNIEENVGMIRAMNLGHYNASYDLVFHVQDDNVFPEAWDQVLLENYKPGYVLTPNQIEPTPSMFKQFHIKDLGRDPKTFNINDFWEYDFSIANSLNIGNEFFISGNRVNFENAEFATNGFNFDVGSNFGIRSYPFLTAGYDCVLFEPQDFCNQYVLKVAEINNFNLKIEQAVLSDKDEFIDFYVSKSTWFSSLSKEAVELHEQSEKIKVQSILLDNYCEKYKIFPSIVKIDVEGFEWQVLQGAKKLIEERTPTLIIEIWHNNPSKSDIFNYLIQQNYQIFSINQEYLIPINTLSSFMACNQPDYAFICDQWIINHINIKST